MAQRSRLYNQAEFVPLALRMRLLTVDFSIAVVTSGHRSSNRPAALNPPSTLSVWPVI